MYNSPGGGAGGSCSPCIVFGEETESPIPFTNHDIDM